MSNIEEMNVDEDEDSSDLSEDDDKEAINRAEELEQQLSSNKFLYDAHVEIAKLYRKLGDLNSMRQAYQRFCECFPLTPTLWLEWIKDEIKIANTPEEHKHVFELFDRALQDYLSVDLWIEYAQFSIGVTDLQTTRSILERGLTAAGVHASKGSLLWDTLRELEHAHISLYTEGSDEWRAQVYRLADVFKRQLSVPLLNMESTYNEWKDWASTLPEGLYDTKTVDWGYKKALKILEIYEPFEQKLLEITENELYEVYKEYIKAVKDPSTVICLYERAILPLCLLPNIWLDYCMYTFKFNETALNVSNRSLRNCPWSEDLWITKIRVLEAQGKKEHEILATFEQGLNSMSPSPCIDLWLSYLEYVHRNIKDTVKLDKLFYQAFHQLNEHDSSCRLGRWHARLLATRGDMASARKIWNSIMNNPTNKGSANVWLEYAFLERQYGEPNQLRSIFKKALAACKDWNQCLSEEWIMYEREFGTLETVMKCIETCKNFIKIEVLPQQETGDQSLKCEKNKKRKHETFDETVLTKKSKYVEKMNTNIEKKQPLVHKHIDKNPKTTVFVSNLHYSVTDQTLKELFPNATHIEIVFDRKGKSRCYGYMQFSKEEEVLTALAQDRIPIDGRPVFISEIKPEKTERKTVFKYAQTTEGNKLFVRGLPTTKTKDEVEEIFKPYCPIAVRLIVKKNGQSKGLAYIEFENEEAAQKALKATDQMKVDDNVITVAVSAPPPKQNKKPDLKDEPIRHARSRLQVPLIPRSLQVQNSEGKGSSEAVKKPDAIRASKSNADFRNMLLKK